MTEMLIMGKKITDPKYYSWFEKKNIYVKYYITNRSLLSLLETFLIKQSRKLMSL